MVGFEQLARVINVDGDKGIAVLLDQGNKSTGLTLNFGRDTADDPEMSMPQRNDVLTVRISVTTGRDNEISGRRIVNWRKRASYGLQKGTDARELDQALANT